jgi:VWFA-related protein
VCVYWFHPLAWWIDRELAILAEEACDDIALSQTGDKDQYAETLVEFARAAAGRGRLNWGAVWMAKESNVSRRLGRIANWRAAPKPFGRATALILLACSLPLIYLSAAVELAAVTRRATAEAQTALPAQSQETVNDAASPSAPERNLVTQAAPNPRPRPAPPVLSSGPDNPPVSMCIVIDTSGSMLSRKNEVKAAALALVGAARPGDEICILDFSDEAYVRSNLTTDLDRARDALMIVDSHGGSALRDAIKLAAELVGERIKNKRVLVVITDGDDNASTVAEEEMRNAITSSGVTIYCIGLPNDRERVKTSETMLIQLASLTGGVYYHPESANQIEGIASAIARNVRPASADR